jgi:hypothetical protein
VSRAALGKAWLRRLRRVTGLDIVWASGNAGYVFEFTTADHRHGQFDLKAYRNGGAEVWWLYDRCPNFTSCYEVLGVTYVSTPPRAASLG